MGFIGSVLGTADSATGGAGLNYKASPADLQKAVTQEQVNQSYNNTQDAYKQQQAFLQALQGQNGIQNQSNIYNQYAALAQGQGPSLAQAQLNNATGQNVSNQAALMASQRGAGANTGLIARQAAQQGANIQQNAVGQGAALRQQEQLSAMGQQAALATQQVGQQQNATQFSNQAAQNEQQNLLNSVAAYNNAQVGSTASQNAANSGLAQVAAKGQQEFMKSLMAGPGQAANSGGGGGGSAGNLAGGGDSAGSAAMMAYKGGVIKNYADGGEVDTSGESFLTRFSKGFNNPSPGQTDSSVKPTPTDGTNNSNLNIDPQKAALFMQGLSGTAMAHGGKVKAMVSPGEIYLPPKKVKEVAKGKEDPIKAGKRIPGKAKVNGDSQVNDTVPASLDVGGMVIPRTVVNSKNPRQAIYKFIDAELAKNSLKRPSRK